MTCLLGFGGFCKEALDGGEVLGREVDGVTLRAQPGNVAVNSLHQAAGCAAEALHRAALGKLAQMHQREVGELREGWVASPLRQVCAQELHYLGRQDGQNPSILLLQNQSN